MPTNLQATSSISYTFVHDNLSYGLDIKNDKGDIIYLTKHQIAGLSNIFNKLLDKNTIPSKFVLEKI